MHFDGYLLARVRETQLSDPETMVARLVYLLARVRETQHDLGGHHGTNYGLSPRARARNATLSDLVTEANFFLSPRARARNATP